ncbi:uncharacterized protein LOC130694261 [Daphnia carinata]|uniref:uncharacterized protein LOC130694261 n=1 Tax=Daphnia carinata TaxID=120202 RepID=UPI00257E1930|nr:uncharacterized protein LOC130694261 [Daphnia carinata]
MERGGKIVKGLRSKGRHSCEIWKIISDNNRPDSGHNDVVTPSSSTSSPESNSCELNHQAAIADYISDEIYYTQLDESFAMEKILSKKVSFQGENVPVKDLVGTKPEELLSIHSIDELLRSKEGEIKIPSFGSSHFEESLYIKRRVKLAFNEHFIADLANRLRCTKEQLNGECRITSQGQIKWLVDGQRRKQIWENIKQMNDQTSGKIEEDSHLIQLDEEPTEHPVFIICGVAGTGKSTLLSHYYSEIKKTKPDCWVIRLNLVEHSDAILKFDTKRPDFIGFLIDHIHVVDSKSPFSRSLLNHRFETGKQIVFMFDGFDEIGEKCQEIAIQMMKSIKKKGIQLYVTTRPHVAHHLQHELGQLAYYLENFNKEDQIDYLTKYWKKELKLPDRVQDRVQEMKIKKIEEFAELLVDKVSETLKDEERAFIGIPLQCRILAECYQQHVDDILRSNAGNDVTLQSCELVSKKLLALLDNEKFDLVSLYSRLMDTKRKVFLQEKSKTCSNLNKDVSINSTIEKIEFRLTKLAVETIITEPNILEVFWPTKPSYISSKDVARKEERLAINSLSFGLTFSNGNGMRHQFLHRTFAEYLVAKYFYKGFHPDDERHNKLLENKSVRKLILNEILASKEYDGVQVFFDSMVKTLVDEDQEWRKKINHRDLPDRLTKMMTHKKIILQPYFRKAFTFSVSNGKGNIFRLFCDCLDATFERKIFRLVMDPFYGSSNNFFSLTFFEDSKFFNRFISYLDILDQSVTYDLGVITSVIKCLLEGMVPNNDGRLLIERNSLWNRDGHLQTMNDFLEFLEKQNVAFDRVCSLRDSESFTAFDNLQTIIPRFLLYLICHDKYCSHLERFMKLLSKSKTYSYDLGANLFIQVFQSKEQMMTGQIAKTLKILKKLGRSTLLVKLYGVALPKEPEAFRDIYQPFRLEEVGAIPTDRNILLKRDEYGMTLLHGAAFYGDVDIVEQILARFRQPELGDGAKEELRKVVLEGYTPFYFAAVKNHEQVCSKLLAFVKDFPDAPTGKLTGLNIRQPLDHAMKSENVGMFQLILNVVNKDLGHDCLLDLLITEVPFTSSCIFSCCFPKKLFNAMVKSIISREGVVDYKCLHDLIFNKKGMLDFALERMDAEHVQGLLSVEGVGPFINRLLTDDLKGNFDLLSSYLLKNFNETQLWDFVKMITLKDPPNDGGTTTVHAKRVELRSSIWVDFLRSTANLPGGRLEAVQVETILKCLTCVSDKLGGDFAKELLLHQDDCGYVVLHLSKEIVKRMLNCLPEKNQEEIKKEWMENGPPMTHDTFINYDSKGYEDNFQIARHYSNILLFYLVYGGEKQLGQCVDILTSVRLMDTQQRSLWSYIFEHCEVTTTNDILKSVPEIFGCEALKKLLFHEMDGSPLLLKALSWGHDIGGRLDMFPQEIRKVVQQVIEQKAADFIDQVFLHPGTYFNELLGRRFKRLTLLKFLIDYSNDRQREQFLHNITHGDTQCHTWEWRSIWTWVILPQRSDIFPIEIPELDTFLKCVSEKLGTKAVKELVLHEFRYQPVIYYLAEESYRNEVDVMLAYLDAVDRTQIQSQINEFLRKTHRRTSDFFCNNNWNSDDDL